MPTTLDMPTITGPAQITILKILLHSFPWLPYPPLFKFSLSCQLHIKLGFVCLSASWLCIYHQMYLSSSLKLEIISSSQGCGEDKPKYPTQSIWLIVGTYIHSLNKILISFQTLSCALGLTVNSIYWPLALPSCQTLLLVLFTY